MKKLLLHACCGPCLAGTLELFKDEYDTVIFWFNPNIEPREEHDKRLETLKSYVERADPQRKIIFSYDYPKENRNWHHQIKGLEKEPEGGKRCEKCFTFRLERAATIAKKNGMALSTTLPISPHKDSKVINDIGEILAKENEIIYIKKNFESNSSYKKSIEISQKYSLYRQKYCGCRFSLND